MHNSTNRFSGNMRRLSRAVSSGASVIMAALLLSGCVHVKDAPEILYSQIEETAPETAKTPQAPKPAEKKPEATGSDSGKAADAEESSKEKSSEEEPQAVAKPAAEAVDKPSAEEVQTAIYYAMPGMDCWGDSITEGFLGDGVTWPATFRELLDTRLIDPIRNVTGYYDLITPEVRNMGVSTETVPEITGRRGAVPFILTKNVTIPADRTGVDIEFVSYAHAFTTKPLRYGDGTYGNNGINPVTIAGIQGELTRYFDASIDSSRYRFERFTEGDAVTVTAGERVRTAATDLYSDDFCVVMMGANGGYLDAQDLADQFELMASMQNNGKFLLIGMGCTPVDSGLLTKEEEMILQGRLGDRFISLQAWMSAHGIEYANELLNAGIEISEADQARIDAGYTPFCLLNEDGLHYTPDGYRVIAYMIFDEMEKRGYFDDLKAVYSYLSAQ